MSFIAPQAYTKETLAKAFEWVQHQPASIKQVATSPDVLVGLYLKAQRHGIKTIDADAPVSSKKFIDDLKNLKKDFAIFDEPSSPRATPAPISHSVAAPLTAPIASIDHPVAPPQGATAHIGTAPSPMFSQAESSPSYTMTSIQQTQTIHQTSVTGHGSELNLDETSLNHLTNIQKRFNLSSPQEALRMVISVGADHISRWE